MKRFALTLGTWLALGTVAFAAVGEVKVAIWAAVAASFSLFVALVEGRGR